MACTCAPALTALRKEFTALFPGRDVSSDGCCPSAAHTKQNPKSDHEPGKAGAAKGKARAVDLDEDYAAHLGPRPLDPLVPVLLADPRAKYTIYEAVLTYPDGTTRRNKGHDKHLHLSIHDWAVDDTSPWNIARAFTSQEDFMALNDNEQRRILDAADKLASALDGILGTLTYLAKVSGADQVDEASLAKALAPLLAAQLDGIEGAEIEQALRNVLTNGVGSG